MLDPSLIPVVCEGLSNATFHYMKMPELHRLKTLCLKYIVSSSPSETIIQNVAIPGHHVSVFSHSFSLKVRGDDTSVTTDRRYANELDDIDLNNLGYVLCGLEISDIDRLTLDAIENNMLSMSRCAYFKAVGEALINRAMALDRYAVYGI